MPSPVFCRHLNAKVIWSYVCTMRVKVPVTVIAIAINSDGEKKICGWKYVSLTEGIQ